MRYFKSAASGEVFGLPDEAAVPNGCLAVAVVAYEDAEHTERMWRLFACVNTRSDLTAALREFARPTPRVDEPTGLGAVVEDAEGKRWVRVNDGTHRWRGEHHGSQYRWSEIKPLRILSPGVEATS